MDSRSRLCLHLHSSHCSRNRPVVCPRPPPMDISGTPNLQVDVLAPVLCHRHRNHSRATSHRLQPDLVNLEILASSWHGCFSCDHARSTHLQLNSRSQIPQGWSHCRHVVGEQDVPQGRGVGSQRPALVVIVQGFSR